MTPPAPPPRRSDRFWLSLILAVGLLMRGVALLALPHEPESDELSYRCMALNLVSGNEVVDTMGNRAMYNVGYPLFVLAPAFYLAADDLLGARIANQILGGTAILLCYAVAKAAGAGRLGGLLAAAIWALHLPASVYGVYLAKEHLMIPLMLGVFWCALRLSRQPSRSVAIGCGVLFGLLALTGNAALSLAGAVALALLFTPAPLRQRGALALWILVSAVAVTAPWMARNARVLGAPVLNTNGGFNLYLGNNPAATGWFVSIADTPRGETWEELRKTGEIEASQTLKEEAISWARERPAEFLTLALKKAAYFWMPPLHRGKSNPSRVEALVRILWGVQFVAVALAAAAGVCLAGLRTRPVAILWTALACYTAVHMLFYVILRYREPIMPVLAVLAALTLESLVLKATRPRGAG